MKLIKNSFVAAAFVALCLTVTSAIAQHPGEVGKEQFAAISRQLNLTPSQEKQLTSLHASVAAKIKAIMSDTSMDDATRHAAMMKLHHSLMASAAKFLSPTQTAKLEKIVQAHMQMHG